MTAINNISSIAVRREYNQILENLKETTIPESQNKNYKKHRLRKVCIQLYRIIKK